jgi:photosystem II stability/assembly factor-like uncharacterized protein
MIKAIISIIIFILHYNIFAFTQNEPVYDIRSGYWAFTNPNANGTFDNINNPNPYGNSLFTWQFIQTPIPYQIAEVFFLDSLNGWASHLFMGVLKTTNSGFNWETISFNDTTFTTGFNGVHFINTVTGWCVGGALQIRKTTNGGSNWVRQIPPPAAGILRSVYFIDASTGYAAGSKNFPYIPFICKTTNGGVNWAEISPTVAGAQELNDQHWFNASTGWICGYDVLLYTTNGGTSFTNLYSNVPPSGNGHIAILAIQFINNQTGWLGAANLERNNVYKTTNGGANWFFQNNPISQGGMNQINDVKFTSNGMGWAVHGTPTTGAIMYTSDGGANWSIDEVSSNWFDCLHIYSNKKAWCGASGGRVWYTIPQPPLGISNGQEIPKEFSLSQNYPNPFNPTTHFVFRIADFGFVKLLIYDALGREITSLVNEELNPGTYEVPWDAGNYPSGVYYYRLTTQNFTDTKKLILVK